MARILVVDDEEDILAVVESALTFKGGHDVITCSRSPEASGLARKHRVDAVVLDLNMPDMTGFQVLKALRSTPETGGTPVLILSCNGEARDRVEGLRHGANDYLAKPFDPDELLLRLEQLINKPHRLDSSSSSVPRDELEQALRTGSVEHPFYLGRYQVLELVGQGAVGAIFRSWDPLLKRPVALKTLRLERLLDETQRREKTARLLEEAVTSARFSHPHIVGVFDVAEGPEIPFIAMEYVDGLSLSDYLDLRGKLSPERTMLVGLAIASGLLSAHKHDIVHRDVKPGNVLLGRDGSIKVTDFGIAGLISSLSDDDDTVFGTPGYLPPEMLLGEGYGEAGDFFGFGVVLYQCLTGIHPFDAENDHQRMVKTLRSKAPPPHEFDSSIPLDLSELVVGLLGMDTYSRLELGRETVRQLTRWLPEETVWHFDLSEDELRQAATIEGRRASLFSSRGLTGELFGSVPLGD